jgi:hypothetical protein
MPTSGRPAVTESGTAAERGNNNVDDHRVPGGPLLGREDARHRSAVQGVCPEAVDRLGR